MADAKRVLRFADAFAIGCGTVTMDSEAPGLPILLIRCRKTGEYFLPKERENINESLQEAAERETFEETGFDVKILALAFQSCATRTQPTQITSNTNPSDLLIEPFAVTQRETDGTLKIIFWFVSSGNSAGTCEENTQQEDEDFESLWVPAKKVTKALSWPDDQRVALRAVEIFQAR